MYRGELLTLVLLVVASFLTGVISSSNPASSDLEVKRDEITSRALGGGVLRILCLGASITFGYKSSDGNGFRYSLRKKLVENGQVVNMIGSLTGGTMADNQVEGWAGYRIAEVGLKAQISLPQLPNVVCIHVGTNDMIQGYDVPNAASRLATIIDKIFVAVPGVTIIVSTLLPTGASAAEANVLKYNADLIAVVNSRSTAGKRITLVDMHTIADLGSDGVHPTDAGYLKMADVFYNGIVSMGEVIQPPAVVAGVDDAAAPNDKGVIVNVDVSCVVTVALSSTKCATSTSKPQTCDPKSAGCPYGATTTVTTTQISSIVPPVMASSTFVSLKPVVAAATSMSTSTIPTSKEPSSIPQPESTRSEPRSETSMRTTTSLAAIQESTSISTSTSSSSSSSSSLGPSITMAPLSSSLTQPGLTTSSTPTTVVATTLSTGTNTLRSTESATSTTSVLILPSAGSSTAPTAAAAAATTTKEKNSSTRGAGDVCLGWVVVIIGMVGWVF